MILLVLPAFFRPQLPTFITMTVSYTQEAEVPSKFNVSFDDVPQRAISDYVVTRGSDKVSVCSLDDNTASDAPVLIKGTLTAKDGSTIKVVSKPLSEWCIEFSQTDPHLWIRSRNIWYRLSKPAKEYARVHDLAKRRFEICSRLYILLTTLGSEDCTFKGLSNLLSFPYYDMKGYSEKEILMEKDFILAQLREFDDPAIAQSTFLRELKGKKGPSVKRNTKAKKESSPPPSSPAISSTPVSKDNAWQSVKLDAEGDAKLLKRVDKALATIMKHRFAYPFTQPVVPEVDGCPDYLERILNPMDYGTIKKRLDSKHYSSVAAIVEDFRQVTRNCIEYNSEEHEFSKWAVTLQTKFESLVQSAEEAEVAALAKRNPKKRRASGDLPPTGKTVGKKALKVARKGSKSSGDRSPSVSSPSKEEDTTPTKPCARSEQGCDKSAILNSKYCSDTCGFIVAKQRLEDIRKSGSNPEDYIRAHITKILVRSRS